MGHAFDLGVAQAAEGLRNALGFNVGQGGERFAVVVPLDFPGGPCAGEGQNQAGGRAGGDLQAPPAAPDARRVAPAPGAQPEAGQRQNQQRGRAQERHDRRLHHPLAPHLLAQIDAGHGQQPAGAGMGQRHEGADPHPPAIHQGAFRGRQPVGENVQEHRRGLVVDLPGHGGIRAVGRNRVHLEEHQPVLQAQQVDAIPFRLEFEDRLQLRLEALEFGFVLVGQFAVQGVNAVQGNGLRHQPGFLEKFLPDQVVFALQGPTGEGGAGQQQECHQQNQFLPAAGFRQQPGPSVRHKFSSGLRPMGAEAKYTVPLPIPLRNCHFGLSARAGGIEKGGSLR